MLSFKKSNINFILSFLLIFYSYFNLVLGTEGSVVKSAMQPLSTLSLLLYVAYSSLFFAGNSYASTDDVEQHLEMGKKMLAAGQMADALSHFHAAIEGDPNNYMAFYRRATVYLAMGKSKSALPDLDKVIQIKPSFTSARLQRGNVLMKQGKLEAATADFQEILHHEPDNAEAKKHLDTLKPVQHNIDLAYAMFEQHDYNSAIQVLSQIIEDLPWDASLRELRAECYIAQGDLFKAINDIRPTTKLRSDNTQAYFRLSSLYYQMGDADESLTEIRECLKLDPDHPDCFPLYKKVKKLVKQMGSVQNFINEKQWEQCVDKANQMLTTESQVFAFIHKAKGHICHCHAKAGLYKEALAACNEVLEVDEHNIDALCDRAEAKIANEMFEEAVKDYQKAQEVNEDSHRVQEGLKRAQKLLKQSKKRDYYKILGVRRNASKRDIMKAYRKAAVKWHPDKYDGDDKAHAEKMFIDIAAAKEVLTDPEKRAKFDNGEDPLDAEEQAQQNQGFNPFRNGGFGGFRQGGPFRHGGFKFHFG